VVAAVMVVVATLMMIGMVVTKEDWLKKRKMVMGFCNQRACV
jgi:hypothetical protein